MKETDRQAKLVKYFKKAGGHAFKIDSRYLTGIMDLFVHHHSIGTFLCEVKFDKKGATKPLPPKGHEFPLKLTPKQRLSAKYVRERGVLYCWCLIVQVKGGYVYIAGTDPARKTAIYGTDPTLVLVHGEDRVPEQIVALFKEAICDR